MVCCATFTNLSTAHSKSQYLHAITLQLVVPDLGAADGASRLLRRGAHLVRVRVRVRVRVKVRVRARARVRVGARVRVR